MAVGMGGMGGFPSTAGRGITPIATRGRKTQICAYWKESRCTRGQLCAFAHGDHELDPESRMRYLASQPKVLRPVMTPDPKFTVNRKTQICVYWKDGRCTRGTNCSFAHGEEELLNNLRAARAVPEPPVRPKVDTRAQRTPIGNRLKSQSPKRGKPVNFSKRDTLQLVERTECTVLEAEESTKEGEGE